MEILIVLDITVLLQMKWSLKNQLPWEGQSLLLAKGPQIAKVSKNIEKTTIKIALFYLKILIIFMTYSWLTYSLQTKLAQMRSLLFNRLHSPAATQECRFLPGTCIFKSALVNWWQCPVSLVIAHCIYALIPSIKK